MRSQTVYKHLKLVEYTSLPLAVTLFIYILSGYGLISTIPSIMGFTYVTSSKVHTLPLLRYLTTILVAAHSYAGFTILINRMRMGKVIKNLLSCLNLAYASILIFIATLSEIYIVLMP